MPIMTVLQTKLNRPIVTKDLVVRPRLLEKLNAGLDGALTLVIAPAGFGKTTLVSSWLQDAADAGGDTLPATWLSLDERDGDRLVFLHYFVAALRRIFPEAGSATLELLGSRQEVPLRILLDTLTNEIETLPTRFVMVLDDLHAPRSRIPVDLINEWLPNWPRPLHLVLLTRFNPALPLTSLRARGLLNEIRSQDLRFSQAEVDEYFSKVLAWPLDEPITILIQQRLEGWIAGLKMASLFLNERRNVHDLATALLDNDVLIADYLLEEVFAGQPPPIQRFLLKTSILDQLSVSLAEVLMAEDDAGCDVGECMEAIRTADLFLLPLDTGNQWYRYHRLFRDALRRKLTTLMSAQEIRDMHALVAGWFFDHRLPEQAIHHAIEAGNLNLAATYMERSFRDVLNREDRPVLEYWLRMLPEAFVDRSPELLVMRAFSHGFRWELDHLDNDVRRAKALVAEAGSSERDDILHGLISVLEGLSYYRVHQHELVVRHCREALDLLPTEWTYARGMAVSWAGMSLHAGGHPDAAQDFLIRQYGSYPHNEDGYALRILLALGLNQIQSGDYDNAKRTARTMMVQATQGQLPVMIGWALYHLGFVTYEWNQLDKAAAYFEQLVDMFYTAQTAATRNGLIGLAHVARANGQTAEALQILERLGDLDREAHGHELLDASSARARLVLMSGDAEAAERWLQQQAFGRPDQSLTHWMEQTSLTRVRILLARNSGSDTKEAMRILDRIGDLAERTVNRRIAIEVLALRALALLNRGDSAAAQAALIRSLELARLGRFTRTYVDMGPQMQTLLQKIAGQPTVATSVRRILAAYPEAGDVDGWIPGSRQLPRPGRTEIPGHGEPATLTQRELELLSLMAEPISLREIAQRMNISYASARRYSINVYDKFNVHSRWEAVNRAMRDGILSPH